MAARPTEARARRLTKSLADLGAREAERVVATRGIVAPSDRRSWPHAGRSIYPSHVGIDRSGRCSRFARLASLACVVSAFGLATILTGCLPGRCQGGFRQVHSFSERGEKREGRDIVAPTAIFTANSDSDAKTSADVRDRSGVTEDVFFLQSPTGRVPATLTFERNDSAHSCASAASITLRPSAPLPAGDYDLVLLLEAAKWPAITGADVESWKGKAAIVRRYRVE